MKRLLPVLLFLLLPAWACAQSPAPFNPSPPEDLDEYAEVDSYFYIGLAGVMSVPTQSQVPGYQVGGGGEFTAGYAFDDNVAVQVQLDNFYFYGLNSVSIDSLRPLAELKLSLDLDDFQPYVFFGPGLNIQFNSVNGVTTTTTNPAGVAGLGAQCLIANDLILFAEGKYNFNLGNSNSGIVQDIPLEAGVILALL